MRFWSWILMARCCVCEFPTSGSLEFCRVHYDEFRDDISQKKPWVRELKNDAQRERRRNKKEFDNMSLDAIMDREYDNQRGHRK